VMNRFGVFPLRKRKNAQRRNLQQNPAHLFCGSDSKPQNLFHSNLRMTAAGPRIPVTLTTLFSVRSARRSARVPCARAPSE
ncbi:hypothetical protein GOODEAATRI_028711, partial [Goodea atripinnis]